MVPKLVDENWKIVTSHLSLELGIELHMGSCMQEGDLDKNEWQIRQKSHWAGCEEHWTSGTKLTNYSVYMHNSCFTPSKHNPKVFFRNQLHKEHNEHTRSAGKSMVKLQMKEQRQGVTR